MKLDAGAELQLGTLLLCSCGAVLSLAPVLQRVAPALERPCRCGAGRFQIYEQGENVGVLHSSPPCADFLQLPTVDFLQWQRVGPPARYGVH